MEILTGEQVIDGLIAAPAAVAREAAGRLEPEDFDNCHHRTIFQAWQKCDLPEHAAPGSVIAQINRHLLAQGLYRDTDDGLRSAVVALAGRTGHPEQLPLFIDDILTQRFRREVTAYALAIAEHAQASPLTDIDANLARIAGLRRLRARIPDRTVQLIKEGA